MTSSPTGRPSLVTPTGTDTDGFQHRLPSIVNGVAMAGPTGVPAISDGGGPSAANAGTAVVGVSSTSTSPNRSPTSRSSRARWRRAFAMLRRGESVRLLEHRAGVAGEVVGDRRPAALLHVRTRGRARRSRATCGPDRSARPARRRARGRRPTPARAAAAAVSSPTSGSTVAKPRSSDQRARTPAVSSSSMARS